MKPHVCPVCLGRTTVPAHFYGPSEFSQQEERCRSCFGTGVVRVPEPAVSGQQTAASGDGALRFPDPERAHVGAAPQSLIAPYVIPLPAGSAPAETTTVAAPRPARMSYGMDADPFRQPAPPHPGGRRW